MKIYIVSFQSKENNKTKNMYLFFGRESSGGGVGALGGRARAR